MADDEATVADDQTTVADDEATVANGEVIPAVRRMPLGDTGPRTSPVADDRASGVGVQWACPVCGSRSGRIWMHASRRATEDGVSPEAFRPSADRFGEPSAPVLRCSECGHGSVAGPPPAAAIAAAYAEAVDPVSLREEAGRIETARRLLAWAEAITGSSPSGITPSVSRPSLRWLDGPAPWSVRGRLAERLVAPDFRDRLVAVLVRAA